MQEETHKNLQELWWLVQGTINSGYNDIDDLLEEVTYYRNNYLRQAKIDIQRQYQGFSEEILLLKELANKDIGACLDNCQQKLDTLPQFYNEELNECLEFANKEIEDIEINTKYKIGTKINDVEILNFQLLKCEEELTCILSIANKIDLSTINIPQQIAQEIENYIKLADDLKILIKQCTDARVTQMTTEGYIIVSSAQTCGNNDNY